MRIFEHPNTTAKSCPICHTMDDKPVTLISIAGTENGGICEAIQVHVDCLDLIYLPTLQTIVHIAEPPECFGRKDDKARSNPNTT